MPTHDSAAARLHPATAAVPDRVAPILPGGAPAAPASLEALLLVPRMDAVYGCVDWYIYPTPVTPSSAARRA